MKDLALSIWNIFRVLGRIFRVVRNGIFNMVLVLLIIGIAVHYFNSRPADIPPGSTLKLSIIGNIVEERRTQSNFEEFIEEIIGGDNQPRFMVLQDILDMVETAAFDQNIRAILLDLSQLGQAGIDQLQAIGHGLEVFRHQGKKVIAAQDFYTQHQYYLAAYADAIVVNPMGGVELHGFGNYPLYFKEMLDRLEVNYHIFRVGDYKAAVEPIMRTSMSQEAREQNLAWLETIWSTYTSDVARLRGIKRGELIDYVIQLDTRLAEAGGDMAQLALNNKLVDLVLTREELRSYLETNTSLEDDNLIATSTYADHVEHSYIERDDDKPRIGIIVSEGNIVGGNQPAGFIGSESLGELLQQARDDERIEGVVLRLNTAGGSAFAAEIIRQEILELKKAGKPVVISMGSMAASGGYWISADADQIWASPVTLTGSIGIFGAIPTFEKTLANLGIYSDGVGTTPIASGLNLTRPLSPEVKNTIQHTVNNGYERFLAIVANGRHIEQNELASLAEGRIFSGMHAQEVGLVDRLGTLEDAVEATAAIIGADSYSAVYLERDKSISEAFFAAFDASLAEILPTMADMFLPGFSRIPARIRQILPWGDPNHIYAQAMLQLPQ